MMFSRGSDSRVDFTLIEEASHRHSQGALVQGALSPTAQKVSI